MDKKELNQVSIFGGAAIFLLVSILYFASSGTARMIANSIDNGVNTLVENSNGSGSGIALFLSTLGVGASVAISVALRILGGIHLCAMFVTVIQGFVMHLSNKKGKHGLARGFAIWALVRFIIYIVIHVLVFVFLGFNVRSAILVLGLLVFTSISIYSMVSETAQKKKITKRLNAPDPTIHM